VKKILNIMKKRNLSTEEKINKLKERREFLVNELSAANRLDGWHLKGLTQELKTIREKLSIIEEGKKDSL
tara:strand:- start:95 stop:304 length:210 start_codon:yes stop_codon:yes gene_type:complete